MAKADKKWDASAERDLCVSIIMGNQENDRIRHNWPKVHDEMEKLGYEFTKEAVSQHFTKVIMKDFKNRHGNSSRKKAGSALPTPNKTPAKTPAKTPKPSSRKRVKTEEDSGHDADISGAADKHTFEDVEVSPSVKAEERRAKRERSETVLDTDSKFARWEAGLE